MANNKATRLTYPTAIVNANDNGGWHPNGKRAYRKARQTLTNCLLTYKRPQLFHLCFQGRTNDEHKALLQVLIQRLDRKGIPSEWWGSREVDGMKGEHLHIFIVVDANDVRAQAILNNFEERFLGKEAAKRGIQVYPNRPRAEMHKGRYYVELPWLGSSRETSQDAMNRLDDALIWLTYPYKARGKPENAKGGQMFPASRPSRKRSDTTSRKIPGTQRSGIPLPFMLG
jgi:hypothetical protein